jgi:hypothetical protein
MVDYFFIGIIYEGIVLLIALSGVIISLINHIKVRNKLSLLLFLIALNYTCSIFFSWVAKVLNVFSNIDYIIYEHVVDPNTPISWILLRITGYRITFAFIIVAIFLSKLFKGKIFEEEINKINKYIFIGFAIFNLIFSLFIFQKGNVLFEVLIFFFVFVFMIMVYLPFLLKAIKAYKSTDHPSFRRSFLSLSIMSFSYISVLLCLLVDRIYIFFGYYGFTLFYFLSWVFVIIGIFSTYYGYLRLDIT